MNELPPDELAPTRRADDGRTPLVDPGSLPRFHKRGDATRERPIVDEQPLGPLNGHVRVTPIRRLDGQVWFELVAAWGPNPDGSDIAGLFGWPTHRAIDTIALADADQAQAIAARAIERLRSATSSDAHGGRRPTLNLPAIAAELGIETRGSRGPGL